MRNFYVNKKGQLDATVCRHLFTAKSLYRFRASQHPSSGALLLMMGAVMPETCRMTLQ